MSKNKKNVQIANSGTDYTGIALLIVSLLFFIGSFTFLVPCDPMENGNWMACHWAGQTVIGLSVVGAVISAFRFFVKDDNMRKCFSLSTIPVYALAFVIPGHVINICGNSDMRCHTHLATGTSAFVFFLIAIACVDIYMHRKKGIL